MKKLLLANLPEKLAAITISLLMWQVVLRIEQPVTSRQFENIPVSYLPPKGNLFVTKCWCSGPIRLDDDIFARRQRDRLYSNGDA